jgi:DNA replication licensing factor MCM7
MILVELNDFVDYDGDLAWLYEFFNNFVEEGSQPKYIRMLQEIADQTRKIFDLNLKDLKTFDEELAEKFHNNTKRYIELTYLTLEKLIPESHSNVFSIDDDPKTNLMRSLVQSSQESKEKIKINNAAVPSEYKRNYQIRIEPINTNSEKIKSIREISAHEIGKIVTVRVLVNRVNDVKPLVSVCTYLTDEGTEDVKTLFQVVNGMDFVPLTEVTEQLAIQMGVKNGTPVLMQTRGSKFEKFQEIKVQEISSQVPAGSIPRNLTIRARGEFTRILKPGDEAVISGIFMPEPYSGHLYMRNSLLSKTYIEPFDMIKEKKTYNDELLKLTDFERKELLSFLKSSKNCKEGICNRLAFSIAPEIYGHRDIKKALLMLMVGGVKRELPDGMKVRGDLHLCLMGDPGVAKSQLLKFVCNVAPRAIYTNGRGSSGVGLTAAVAQDPTTNEVVLEGGALVLADMGICCIDEFDKMGATDRTSIHEVMEQQTVSIAKAGINTTLNARTSILAAANPAYGRYDLQRSPAENINFPVSLLSRFDLLWLILDQPDLEFDAKMASHVIYVHINKKPPLPNEHDQIKKSNDMPISNTKMFKYLENETVSIKKINDCSVNINNENLNPTNIVLSPKLIRSYISLARECEPSVPEDLTEWLAIVYTEMRKEEFQAMSPTSYTTARTLLSIIRMGQSLARLELRKTVMSTDFEESLRLMRMSKASLAPYMKKAYHEEFNEMSEIYSKILDMIVEQRNLQKDFKQKKAIFLPRDFILQRLRCNHTDKKITATLNRYKEKEIADFFVDDSYNVITEILDHNTK